MNRPFFIMSIFFICGIVVGTYINEYLFFAALILILAFSLKNFFNYKFSILFFLFFVIGLFLTRNAMFKKDIFLENALNNKIEIAGKIQEIKELDSGRYRAVIEIFETKFEKYGYSEKYRIYADIPNKAEISEIISLTGSLENFGHQKNPGEFNEKMHWLSRNVIYKFYALSTNSYGIEKDLNYWINKLKTKSIQIYDNVLPKNESAIMQSMVLGFDDNLSDETLELYKIGGIYHILAISGLHIIILSEIILKIFQLFLSKRKSIFITFAFLIFYGVFTGLAQSTTRAIIMFTIVNLGNLIYRESDLLTSLSLSAFLILIFRPLSLYNIGFQLSFSAVLGIALFDDSLKRILPIKNEYILNAVSSMIAANLIVSLLSMYYFYNFYPYFLIANLIILPTASFILSAGILILFLGFISLNLASFFSGSVYFLLKIYEIICRFLAALPFSEILTGRPGILFFVFYLSFLFILILYLHLEKKKIILFSEILLVAILIWIFLPQSPNTKITMVDVSQGDAFVIEKNKKLFLIDCGNRPRTILNYLDYKGCSEIEAVFLSHTDADHAGALLDIMADKKIKNIFLPKADYEDDEIQKSISEKFDIQYLKNGDIMNFGDLDILCISPKNIKKDINEDSMVLKIVHNQISFLFTGDIGIETELELMNENIQADVLKIAHHGSANSSGIEFLKKVNPQIALISVGKNNYGHPNKGVLDNINTLGAETLRTDYTGAVFLETDGIKLKYRTMVR